VLLVACPDRRGIVAAVTSFIAAHGGNVVDLQQHTDHTDGSFFQRIEFELDGLTLTRDEIADTAEPVLEEFSMRWSLRFTDERPRVAVLVSRESHCLNDLLHRQRSGDLAIDVPLVVSNHPDHADMAAWFGVEYRHLPIVDGDRRSQEALLATALSEQDIDLVVLARYMQVLSPEFCDAWAGRAINIHHSFLPSFSGARPYHQAHERGVKLIGVTAHYVTADLDQGPIIEQDVVRVSHRDNVDDLRRQGRDHVEHRTLVYGRRTVVFD
jgi:formyltetrahydrofolate deformylase